MTEAPESEGSAIASEPSTGGKPPLLNLPVELRLNVWSILRGHEKLQQRLVLKPDRANPNSMLIPSPMRSKARPILPSICALMRTCRLLNAEGQEYLYKNTLFIIDVIAYLSRRHVPNHSKEVLRCVQKVELLLDYELCLQRDWMVEKRLFFENCRTMLEIFGSNNRLREFSMTVRLDTLHLDDALEQGLPSGLQKSSSRVVTAKTEELADAWVLLRNAEKTVAKVYEGAWS